MRALAALGAAALGASRTVFASLHSGGTLSWVRLLFSARTVFARGWGLSGEGPVGMSTGRSPGWYLGASKDVVGGNLREVGTVGSFSCPGFGGFLGVVSLFLFGGPWAGLVEWAGGQVLAGLGLRAGRQVLAGWAHLLMSWVCPQACPLAPGAGWWASGRYGHRPCPRRRNLNEAAGVTPRACGGGCWLLCCPCRRR